MLKRIHTKILNYFVLVLIFTFSAQAIAQEAERISYFGASGKYSFKNKLFVELLELALTNTRSEFGEHLLLQSPVRVTQGRAVEMMQQRCEFDLLWLMTSDEREKALLAVKVPLLKGLQGLRALMIKSENIPIFNNIKSSGDLKGLRAGQGHDWPDTQILLHSRYNVFPVVNYRALFDMLDMQKFDYFPRSVTEIADELKLHSDKGLTYVPHILLRYQAPIYFFVCPDKPLLAKRIKMGLEKAIDDGTFDNLLRESKEFKAFEQLGGLAGKTIFDLKNPLLLSSELPKGKRYWLVE